MSINANSRNNGFDILRIMAAIFVIYGHAFPLTGSYAPSVLGNHISTISVKIFFVISGFLICKSWVSNPNIFVYAKKRIMRIFPALIVNIILAAFIIGPIVSTLSLTDYFQNESFFRYFYNILLYPVYNLPGVFDSNIYPVAVNGSLWSLPVEFFMYILTPVIILKAKNCHISVCCALVFFVFSSIYYNYFYVRPAEYVIYGTAINSLLDVTPYFIIGMFWSVFNLQKFNRPIWTTIIFILGAYFINNEFLGNIFLLVMLPYFVISFGLTKFSFLNFLFRKRDYSYGLYLYGFPIQQLLMYWTDNGLTALENALYACVIALFLAALSWHFIESPALAFKSHRVKT